MRKCLLRLFKTKLFANCIAAVLSQNKVIGLLSPEFGISDRNSDIKIAVLALELKAQYSDSQLLLN